MNPTAKKRIRRMLFYVLAVALALLFIAPTLFMISTSVQTEADVYRLPPKWLPAHPTFAAYAALFTTFPVANWLENTLLYALLAVTFQVIVCSLAAYPLSRMQFVGRDVLLILVLSTIMIPFEVRMIPLYLVTYKLGLVDQRLGLVLPTLASPFTLFLFVQFFKQVPRDLEDSAEIDGCGRPKIFWHVIVPLSLNAFLVVSILTTIHTWNDFFWPLIVMNTVSKQVLSIGIFNLLSSNMMAHIGYPLAMAGCVVMAMPLIILYIFFQRHIINAYLFSGLKG